MTTPQILQGTRAGRGGKSVFADTSGYVQSSQEAGGLFGNLNSLKRDSNDMNRSARKSSMAEQSAQPGFMGQMFNK